MGLHLNVPETLLPERALREHRVRIWWTAYTLEYFLAAKMGHPVSVQDDDITVDMPSDTGLEEHKKDFLDAEHLKANIRLARLSRETIISIYGRQIMHVTFSKRVQNALRNLRSWVEELPKHLQIGTEDTIETLSRSIRWLHLSFSQVRQSVAIFSYPSL